MTAGQTPPQAPPPKPTVLSRVAAWVTRRRSILVALLIGAVVGVIGRGLFPPFVIDNELAREFVTGPGIAGLFALAAAIVAFFAAGRGSRIAREAAIRTAWWERTRWALDLALSNTDDAKTDAGLAAAQLLSEEGTPLESTMVRTVMAGLLEADPGSPNDPAPASTPL